MLKEAVKRKFKVFDIVMFYVSTFSQYHVDCSDIIVTLHRRPVLYLRGMGGLSHDYLPEFFKKTCLKISLQISRIYRQKTVEFKAWEIT